MNRIKIFFLLFPLIGICVWAMYYDQFVQTSAEVVLPITGYDPRNLLSGHYIEYRIDWARADCSQLDWQGTCPREDFVGVHRYYVPENKARTLERLINSSHIEATISFAYRSGFRPVAKKLLINGKPWSK